MLHRRRDCDTPSATIGGKKGVLTVYTDDFRPSNPLKDDDSAYASKGMQE